MVVVVKQCSKDLTGQQYPKNKTQFLKRNALGEKTSHYSFHLHYSGCWIIVCQYTHQDLTLPTKTLAKTRVQVTGVPLGRGSVLTSGSPLKSCLKETPLPSDDGCEKTGHKGSNSASCWNLLCSGISCQAEHFRMRCRLFEDWFKRSWSGPTFHRMPPIMFQTVKLRAQPKELKTGVTKPVSPNSTKHGGEKITV